MITVALSKIAFDAGTQVREAISEQTVSDYAERMAEGVEFPPVVVFHDGSRYYLADGFHRALAAQRNKCQAISAMVMPGTLQDALWFALGANRINGQRLTNADKTHAVKIALHTWPTKMQQDIAEQVGCSPSLVSKVAVHISNNTGVGMELRGKALARQTKREEIRALVEAGMSSVGIRGKLKAHPSVIAEVRREMGVSGVERTGAARQARQDQMRTMAADGHSSRQIASAVGLNEEGCRATLRKLGIDVPADRVLGKAKRHQADRILDTIVMDADNLTNEVTLIVFADLEPSRLGGWLQSLKASRDKLGELIRRLMKEQQKHGQAA